MRAEESAYWDHVAVKVKGNVPGGLLDNIHKRAHIVSKILAHRPIRARVLEIGAGQALAAAAVDLVTLRNWHYTGTDVSEEFCKVLSTRWKLRAVHTDILKLPDGPFDMIWAFDSLEHVRPEERPAGYAEMNRVMAEHAVILLNVPLDESHHDQQFDWGMKEREVYDIAEATGTRVTKWEPYHLEEIDRSYLWSELTR